MEPTKGRRLMAGEQVRVSVGLRAGDDADDAELNQLATQLRAELLRLDVATVDLARHGGAPVGTKGQGMLDVGKLLVDVASSGPALGAVIKALRSWLARDEKRSVTVEIGGDRIELTDVAAADQERLIEHWVATHASS